MNINKYTYTFILKKNEVMLNTSDLYDHLIKEKF